MMNESSAANTIPWQYLPAAITMIVFLVIYHNVILSLAHDWSIDDNFSHGFLIPLISGFLVWQDRERLAGIPVRPANTGLPMLAGSLGLFILAHTGAELFTLRFSMILVLFSLLVYLAGWKMAGAVFFPLLYLAFMIPLPAIIWNKIAFPLKLFATDMAVNCIKILGLTVYSEGNIIFLPNTTLEVVDACSGLRSLMSLMALSAAFALISTHGTLKKWLLFFAAVPVAIVVNIFRLTVTAVLAKIYGPEVAEGFLHDASGILVFIVAFMMVYGVHWILMKVRFPGDGEL